MRIGKTMFHRPGANWAIDLQGFEDAGTVRGPLVDGYLWG